MAILLSRSTSAQSTSSFIGDTLIPPHLFDLREHGVLHDFGFDDYGTIGLIGRSNGQGTGYTYIVRYDEIAIHADTLYEHITPPFPTDLFFLDVKGKSIALGFGFYSYRHRFIVSSDDAGHSWDTVDIGDTAYYQDFEIVKPRTWLLKSLSPLTGWRYVTRDTAYWIFHQDRTNSWIQQLANDSLLLFVRGIDCPRTYDPDTGYFQVVSLGEVIDEVAPVAVPSASPPPVPSQMGCPLLRLIGLNDKRIWFTRRWIIGDPDSMQVSPTALYSYNLTTASVQYEYFFPRPRSEPASILFANHIFVALDSQLVVRHVDDPPGSPFMLVPGITMFLRDLKVHDGVLYGARSNGLIMRIRQVSSVPSDMVDQSVAFTAEIEGSEIVVCPVDGTRPREIPLELFDTQGRRLSTSSIASGSSSGRLPAPSVPGVYFLRCGGSENSTTLRVFVP